MFSIEFHHLLSLLGLPEHELKLKVNREVIFSQKHGLKGRTLQWVRARGQTRWTIQMGLHKLEAEQDDKYKVLILPRSSFEIWGSRY